MAEFNNYIPGYTGPRAQPSVIVPQVDVANAGVGFTAAGRLFAGLAARSAQIEDRRARVLGTNAGALAGLTGNYKERPVGTISGDAFNAAATDTFNKRLELQANTKIAELSAKHAADPAALDESLSAYRDGVLGEISDDHPQTAGAFKVAFAGMAGDAVNQAVGQRQKQIIDENRATTAAVVEQRGALATQLYRRAGGGDPAALALGNVQRDAVVAEYIANGPSADFTINGVTYPAGSGAYSAVEIEEKVSKLDQELTSQGILGWWQQGPASMARAQAWRANAPAGMTQDQIDKTYNSMVSDVKDAITVSDHADAMSDKATRKAGEAAAKALEGLAANGALTRDMLEKAAPILSVGDYKGLLHSLTAAPDVKDDSDTVSLLEQSLGAEGWSQDAAEALAAGQISTPTYLSMSGRNRSIAGDDKPAGPYKSSRSLVSTTLDPGQLLSGPAAAVARAGLAQALVEFDNYAAANPDSTRAELTAEAQNTIKRYQIITYNEMATATGLPRFYEGGREDLTFEALTTAEAETIRQLDGNGITREMADQELRKIETWRYLLGQKPADKTPKVE